MAIIGSDTFQRGPVASGSWDNATDGQPWTQSRGIQTMDVTNNTGRLTYNGNSTTGVMTLGRRLMQDGEDAVRFQVATGTDLAGLTLRFQDSNNFYSCIVGNTANTLTFRRDLAGTFTTVGIAITFNYSINTWYWLHFRIVGSLLLANIWADGTPEPGNWMMAATDTGIAGPGQFGVVATPTGVGNTEIFDSFRADDLVPAAIGENRWTLRSLLARIFQPYPSVPLPDWRERGIGATFVMPTQPTNIPRYVRRSLTNLLANYALNITTRFRLMSANVLNDVSTRFILVGGTQSIRDIASRFRLMQQSVRDIASRLRLRSADQLKDIQARFRLKSADQLKDIVSRFRLKSTDQLKDIVTRFRLKSADQLKDVQARFRLMSANQLKDIVTRFRLKSADQLKDISTRFILASASQRIKDIASRFRLMSANQLKDITSRFRLMSANQVKDMASRFRLRSANQLKDIQSRFRVMSANQVKDISTRLRLKSANQLRDIASRFILHGVGTQSLRDISTRFVLIVPSNAIWITRDGRITWLTRDDKAGWSTRDDKATWDTRDDKATWDTRDDVATWKTR